MGNDHSKPQKHRSITMPFPSKCIDLLNETNVCEDELSEKVHSYGKRQPLIILISAAKRDIFSESMRNNNNIVCITAVTHEDIRQAAIQLAKDIKRYSWCDSVIVFPVCIINGKQDNGQNSFSPQFIYDQHGVRRPIDKWENNFEQRFDNRPLIVDYSQCVWFCPSDPERLRTASAHVYDTDSITEHITVDSKCVKRKKETYVRKSQNSSVTNITHSSPQTQTLDARSNGKQQENVELKQDIEDEKIKVSLNVNAVPFALESKSNTQDLLSTSIETDELIRHYESTIEELRRQIDDSSCNWLHAENMDIAVGQISDLNQENVMLQQNLMAANHKIRVLEHKISKLTAYIKNNGIGLDFQALSNRGDESSDEAVDDRQISEITDQYKHSADRDGSK
eukprot:138116_1